MDGRPTWTDCDEAGDYVVPNVLSPMDLVSRPDIMDETVPLTQQISVFITSHKLLSFILKIEHISRSGNYNHEKTLYILNTLSFAICKCLCFCEKIKVGQPSFYTRFSFLD